MKKVLLVLLACGMFFIFSGCKNGTLEDKNIQTQQSEKTNAESKSFEITSTIAETTYNTELEFNEFFYNECVNSCKTIMNAMVNKDIDKLLSYSGHKEYEGPTDMYDFFKDINIDKYIIDEDNYTQLDTERYILPVTLFISKSDNKMFPVGESKWSFLIGYTPFECIVFFENSTETPKVHIGLFDNDFKYSNAVNYCYNLTNYLKETYYDKTQQGKINTFEYKSQYLDMCATPVIRFLQSTGYLKDYADYTVKNITNGFEKMIGTVGCDFTLDKTYKKDTDTLDSQHLGGWWSSATLSEETYNKDDNTYTIVIDWWADNMFMVKARTIRYTITPIEDKQFKLISLEYLYDSKYKIEGGSD